MKSKMSGLDLAHDVRYIIFIYDNPNCSQEDIVNMFGQSKGNIANQNQQQRKELADVQFL